MKETSKSISRRLRDPNFISRYFRGTGIDIGAGTDPVSLYHELFPLMGKVRIWDIKDGDAQVMEGVEDNTYDFVHSSHCIEHLHNPVIGLENWIRIVKPGGFVIVTVPDEDLYEQGIFPSNKNSDHKWTFTIYKKSSWSEKSINVLELLTVYDDTIEINKVELLNQSYRYSLPQFDQTLTPVGECAIEFILRKRTAGELEAGGRLNPKGQLSKLDFEMLTGYRLK